MTYKKEGIMKKTFIVLFAVVLAITSTSGLFAATTEKPVELTFSFHAPPQASMARAAMLPWAADLEKASNGRVKIKQYPGGSVLSAADAYDGVVDGIVDIAQVATEEYPGRFPLSEMHILPLMYPNCEMAGLVGHMLQNKYCANAEMKDVKILMALPLHAWNYLGNKPIEKLADFKGLKIRAPGKIDGMELTALGATPVNVLASEAFSSLDRGVIDGTVFTWAGALAFGFYNVAKYKTEVGLARNVHWLVMNKKVYAKLPADIKKLFDDFSTPEISRKYSAAHDKLEPGAKIALVKKSGSPITVLPPEEKAKIAQAVQVVRDEWAKAHGATGKAILDDAANLVKQYAK